MIYFSCERPGCGFSFCYHCKAEWHPNQTCDMARVQRHHHQVSVIIDWPTFYFCVDCIVIQSICLKQLLWTWTRCWTCSLCLQSDAWEYKVGPSPTSKKLKRDKIFITLTILKLFYNVENCAKNLAEMGCLTLDNRKVSEAMKAFNCSKKL